MGDGAAQLEGFITEATQGHAVEWVGDHLITLDQEIDRMWITKWSIPKVLFVLNRYLASPMLMCAGLETFDLIAAQLPLCDFYQLQSFCVFYLRWLTWTIWTQQTVVEAILLCRLWALFGFQRVSPSLTRLRSAGVIAVLVLTLIDYIGESVTIVDAQGLPGCYAASVPKIIAGYWITPVIIEFVMFIMTIIKTFRWISWGGGAPPTLILLALLLLANLFVFEFGPPFLSSLMITPSNTAGCIAGSRMLLNILGINYNDDLTYADTELEFVQGRTVVTTTGGITTFGSTAEPTSETLASSESTSKEPMLFPILEHSDPEPVDITPNPAGRFEV
ncbi:hypothetical protein SISNIDRAFT_458809 [Sistotremastrum niveocremeum HHB9708]|uniref:DUF6533 domain-containing protein n=1 Tax=Sistotremastrum niveocremeum HHB9708 TaxID=1314777 RepID=A0A164Q511_9AGAM|nr:hypothetical protein SISNIDRAFT_458809 [Sistotremastrum niveocremeum HHB9708]